MELLSDKDCNLPANAVAPLVQVLQVEDEPVRVQLVRKLASISNNEASVALAQRAVFDLSEVVREAAIQALRTRPRKEYRPILLKALRYPWAPAANHAAAALVALGDREAINDLVALLDQPDPQAPVLDNDKKWVKAELVKVNHLRNCLLCHAPATNLSDPIRGLIPTPGKPIPVEYYESRKGSFVRADVTYLKQDFSLLMPVAEPGVWPAEQRYDFLVRRRPLTEAEVAELGTAVPASSKSLSSGPGARAGAYPQRDAVLLALRQLTGEDLGEQSERWQRCFAAGQRAARP